MTAELNELVTVTIDPGQIPAGCEGAYQLEWNNNSGTPPSFVNLDAGADSFTIEAISPVNYAQFTTETVQIVLSG